MESDGTALAKLALPFALCGVGLLRELRKRSFSESSPAKPTSPCSIPKTEERGVTAEQLGDVYASIEQESATWRAPERFGGQLLNLPPKEINLYHVNDNLIKIKTEPFKCSYIELVATARQNQIPRWFVSQ